MKSINTLTFILIFNLVFISTAQAGKESKKGTAGAQELLIPIEAKGLALGNSTVSFIKGIQALSWNPAGLANSENVFEILFSYNSYIADIGINYAALQTNINGIGSFALSFKSIDFAKIEETTENFPEGTGNYFSPVFFNIGLSYSRRITDRLTVGLTTKYIYENVYKTSASGLGFDAGVQYVAGNTGLLFGIVLKNVGPALKFEGKDLEREIFVNSIYPTTRTVVLKSAPFDLPSSLELGFAYTKKIFKNNNIIISGSFENNNFGNDLYKTGFEYSFNDIVFLRTGYIFVPEETTYVYQFTYGIGLKYEINNIGVGVDFAYRPVKFFGSHSIINIQLNF